MPAGVAGPPRGIPFQRLILKFGLCEPEDKVVDIALVAVLFHAFPDPYRQILFFVRVEDIIAIQFGRVKIDVSSGEIGVSGLHQAGNDFDIVVNAAGRGLNHVGAFDIQLAAVVKESVGIELRDFHDRLVFAPRALEHFILSRVRVRGQMPHVGNIHDAVDTVSGVTEKLFQRVLTEIGPQIADMGIVIDGRAAGVHFHMSGGVRGKFRFFVRCRVVKIHKCLQLNCIIV